MNTVANNKSGQPSFRAEVTRYLFFGNAGVLVTGGVVAALLALMLWGTRSAALMTGWLILVELVYLSRILLAYSYRRAAPADAECWLKRFRAGVIATGLGWGTGIFLLFPANDLVGQSLLTMTVGGMAAGGTIAYAIDSLSLAAFIVPLALPLIARQIAEGTSQSMTMGAMVAMFLGYVWFSVRRNSADIHDNIRLRIDAIKHEETIREQNEFLRTILESEPECVKVVAPNGELLQMNRAGLAMIEVDSVTEARQIGLLNMIQPEFRDAFVNLQKSVFKGNAGQLEFMVKGNKGSLRWLITHASPLRDKNGRVAAMVGVTSDITERKRMESALRESEEKLRGFYELSPLGIALTDMDGHYVEFNEAFRRICGYSEEELKALDYWALTPKKYEADEARQLESLNTTGHYGPYEKEYIRKDGSPIPLRLNGVLVTGRDGRKYIWSLVEDITESKRVEENLRIAATAFESQEGIVITDANNAILRVNSAFTSITGYAGEEVMGKNLRMLNSGRQDDSFYTAMWQGINRTGAWEGEIWNRRKNGEIYPERLSITAVKDSNGAVSNYVATLFDITESKAAESEIRHLAFYDPLTHLPNRRLLMDRLRKAFASSARSGGQGAILLIDLDNFKDLNDTLGHDMGDMLLQQAARRLESCVREGDTVSRLGGDEFVVMLEELSKQALEAAAQTEDICGKIHGALNQPYHLGAREFRCAASIGAVLFSGHRQTTEELIKQADIALYQAKKAGRNTLRFFDPQMQEAINARAALEEELHRALENRQFHLYYQIQVDASGRPFGAEALIRWVHPQDGVVAPVEFIQLAEETGLILPIGQWALDEACAQVKRWQSDPLLQHLVVAVNVSGRQFREPEFASRVQAAIRRNGISPMRLKLELTESVVLENIDDAIAKMHILKEFGVQLSLDDFGTGYSSLSYLKRLPLDQIKIDQSFVRDLNIDQANVVMVRTIVDLGMNFGVDVVAEGVETEDQFKLLQRYGCTGFQGFLLGKPMPIDEFEERAKQDERP
jgi:diguanylate cyclase (GGDEF)-like protein/PAS domain S-box-containing protein